MRFSWTLLLLPVAFGAGAPEAAERARCGGCHVQSRQSETNPMTGTLLTPSIWVRPPLAGKVAGYEYRIYRDGSQLWYETRSGEQSLRIPVSWIFGSGRTGQTFILSLEGQLRESRVSYYPKIKGLDLTIGAANSPPTDLREAAGRLMSKSDVRDCFGCHSSAVTGSKGGEPPTLVAGVGCERCHGEATAHAAKPARGSILSLKTASTEEISELCGQCHRTWEQVMMMKLKGVNTIRFQPYRLSQSRCYNPADRRIACTACHDPHQAATISMKRVDAACQACHAKSEGNPKVCHTGQTNCASCHMPKFELPGAHAAFSDHRIRVATAGASYPD